MQVEFHDADGEVHFPHIIIGPQGGLRAVVCNSWSSGESGADQRIGYYSLLHHAQELVIWDNPRAIRDLLAYVEGAYPLGGHWQRRQLTAGARVVVQCGEADLLVVGQLRRHLTVDVRGLGAPLRADNAVSAEYARFTFTGCRAAQPRSLAVDARTASGEIEFRDADGEVRIPSITIGPKGSLGTVMCNSWWNGREGDGHEGGRYSLLRHAEALTIRGNPQAVRDLAACVTGKYETGGPRWPAQALNRHMQPSIEGVAGCEAEVGALAEHFGAIRVDGKTVLSRRRR